MSCKKELNSETKPCKEVKSRTYKIGVIIGSIFIVMFYISLHTLLIPYLLKIALNGVGVEIAFLNCMSIWIIALLFANLFRGKKND